MGQPVQLHDASELLPGPGGVDRRQLDQSWLATPHQDRRQPGLVGCRASLAEGGEDFLRVLAAALDQFELIVGKGVHHALQFRVAMHPMLTLFIARHDGITLVITIHAVLHALAQYALVILGQQAIPAAAPDHLDHIPVGTAETAFQLLDDFAVTANRTIQALQVTIDHQHQVIQAFPGSDIDRAQNFGLI